MLNNELKILSTFFIRQDEKYRVGNKKNKSDFNKVVAESCSRARDAWTAAAFSDSTDEALHRYFDFHFSFLNGLIAEYSQASSLDDLSDLFKLMDNLLSFYKKFIDQHQPLAREYINYRIRSSQLKYDQFAEQLAIWNADAEFNTCLTDSLSPIYRQPIIESLELGALFYREDLINDLAGKRNCPELMNSESLISTLISFNFNHTRFLGYLRKRAINDIANVAPTGYTKYFIELKSEIPPIEIGDNRSFDSKWPHISVMYRDWLDDYRVLLSLNLLSRGDLCSINKVPLNISVKQLACMIRALYESGLYGHISLTAIFDHAATVFTTKKQEHISAESISNAYYALSQSAALKTSRMFGNAIEFLKPYCFPA
jgi:hypothetical protein